MVLALYLIPNHTVASARNQQKASAFTKVGTQTATHSSVTYTYVPTATKSGTHTTVSPKPQATLPALCRTCICTCAPRTAANTKGEKTINPNRRYVTFVASEVHQSQIDWGNHRDPRGLLEVGKRYRIQSIEVHSWHTKVYLEGFEGHFNSIWFD